MFALIDTKNASHIAIHIPAQGADKAIPALVGMLEQNAVFIKKQWSALETVVPEMSIQLGDKLTHDNSEGELAITIPGNANVLGESFVHETPEVRISNKKAIDKKDAEISRLRAELTLVKQQLADSRDRINALTDKEIEE
jgi:hypothetical protein